LEARFQIAVRDIGEQFVPKLLGGAEDPIKHRAGTPLQVHRFPAPIRCMILAGNPAILLQPVKDTGQSRFFDPDARRDLALGELVGTPREVRQRSPLAHAQAQRLQTLVQLRAPGASGLVQEKTELFDIAIGH